MSFIRTLRFIRLQSTKASITHQPILNDPLDHSFSPVVKTLQTQSSPLAKHITDIIKMTGPLSIATYMRQALTSPLGGYYMTKTPIGKTGDFTTSPEISQLFGVIINTQIT